MGETKPVIKVNCFVVGAVQTNFYFLYREGSPDTIVFDPADLGDRLYEELDKRGLKVKAIFLTHAHFDHIVGTAYPDVLEKGIPSRLHPLDKVLYEESKTSMNRAIPILKNTPEPRMDLEDGMMLNVGPYKFEVLFTPGHAPGHCCFYCEQAGWLFSGDLVFYHSYGRTDLTGGDEDVLMKSIREKVLTLPPETLIMPGHNDYTRVRDEKVFY